MSDGEFQRPHIDEDDTVTERYMTENQENVFKQYNIKDLVKDNFVYFNFFRQGHFYYNLVTDNATYIFPVPIDDIGTATLNQRDKALTYMRYIRKAIENQTFIKL